MVEFGSSEPQARHRVPSAAGYQKAKGTERPLGPRRGSLGKRAGAGPKHIPSRLSSSESGGATGFSGHPAGSPFVTEVTLAMPCDGFISSSGQHQSFGAGGQRGKRKFTIAFFKPQEPMMGRRLDQPRSLMLIALPRDLADRMSGGPQLETFTLSLDAARCKARKIIDQEARSGLTPVIEKWRQLPDGRIEFAIRHFPASD